MAQVFQGPIGTAAFGVDDVYLSVQQPSPQFGASGFGFNGGAPGIATWGPVNSAQLGNTPGDLLATWGPPLPGGLVQEGSMFLRQSPLGGFFGVRITDGTDVKATGIINDGAGTPATGFTATAYYTGSYGNQISILLTAGSNSRTGALTYKVIIQAGTNAPEIFDRIPNGTTSPWANIVNVINNGQSALRPASKWVTLTVGASIVAPTFGATGAEVVTLTAGTDGATTITSTIQLGVNGNAGSRTGMYVLSGLPLDAIWLCNNSDSTAYSTVLAFAKTAFAEAYLNQPTGLTITAAIAAKNTAGIDDPYAVVCKDYVQILDTILNGYYMVAPACVIAGVSSAQAAYDSPSNQQVYGIIGTENTIGSSPQVYNDGDLALLEEAGILVITNPIPSANAFGLHYGKNSSSNAAVNEIAYTRQTNSYLRDLGGTTLGQFVGRRQTTNAIDPLRTDVSTALNGYFGPRVTSGEIVAYKVVCDLTNNPSAQIKQGILVASVTVEYGSIVDKFLINLTAGQTVDVSAASQAA